MNKDWTLYGTIGCHLCDDAELLLQHLKMDYCYVDICDDPILMSQYGVEIPVLTKTGQPEMKLKWPFDVASLLQWQKTVA